MRRAHGEAAEALGAEFRGELDALDVEVRRVAADAATKADVARLEAAIARLEARMDGLLGGHVTERAPAPKHEEGPPPEAQAQGITHDEVVLLAAAAAAFLGVPARIRSARRIGATAPPVITSPWGQQGRVLIQGSHDLGARRAR
jgi:anti-sigma factor RsiW